MKKRIFALLLCIAMVLSITIITSAEDTEAPAADAALTEVPLCTCGTEDDIHADTCPMYVAPAEPETPEEPEAPGEDTPVCTCGTEDDTHAEDCPLYVALEEELTCTCGTEDDTHAEDCPLYVAPELSLYEKLMATETAEEFDSLIAEYTSEELVFSCEEFDDLDAHYIYLTTGEYPNYEPVVDVVLSIVDFTNAAPLVGSGK